MDFFMLTVLALGIGEILRQSSVVTLLRRELDAAAKPDVHITDGGHLIRKVPITETVEIRTGLLNRKVPVTRVVGWRYFYDGKEVTLYGEPV